MRKKPHPAPSVPSVPSIQGTGLRRRQVLQGGAWGGTGLLAGCASWRDYVPTLSFGSSAASTSKPLPQAAEARAHKASAASAPATAAVDRLTVAAGHKAVPVAAWGDPVGLPGASPAWRPDAGNTAAEQAVQLGMHHGGLQYLPLDGSARGLLVMAHEGVDDGLLQPRGAPGGMAEKVKKSQAAVGLSVVEVALAGDTWQPVRPSRLARRITARTPVALSGPAAGHPSLRTAADPAGRRVLGALAGGGITLTPWGTALVGEQGYARAFATADQPTGLERRYGLSRSGGEGGTGSAGKGYRWHEIDERYDTVRHPNEPNRHGWIIEFDPNDPQAPPVKRTALGRGAHAATAVTRLPDNERVVVYAADGGAFEYLSKFISRDAPRPAERGRSAAQANADLLDEGTLYVARFNADGSGQWLPMVHGQGPLTPARGFADAGEVLIKARLAADALGATRMDTPEALAVHATSGWVYAAMARNPLRGGPGQPPVDAANPHPGNALGQLLRWRERPGSAGELFDWQLLQRAGDAFAQPAALALDPRGGLWLGTGVPSVALGQGELAGFGRNQLLRCAGVSKSDAGLVQAQRFLSTPVNAEIGGLAFTPDGRTLFVNIAHPGETPGAASDPNAPNRLSNWPDFKPDGRPRSATVALRRDDGGSVGG
jgi:secreted PhoX family phosphatase